MRFRPSVVGIALCLAATSSLAAKRDVQDIDFGALTCGEFIEEIAAGSQEDAGAVMLWIDGYLSGVSGDTVLNWRGLEDYSERLAEYCGTHPRVNLLDAARRVGIRR